MCLFLSYFVCVFVCLGGLHFVSEATVFIFSSDLVIDTNFLKCYYIVLTIKMILGAKSLHKTDVAEKRAPLFLLQGETNIATSKAKVRREERDWMETIGLFCCVVMCYQA